MRRALSLLLIAGLGLFGLAACGSDDESSTDTTEATSGGEGSGSDTGSDSGSSGGGNDTGNAKVDEYCDQVDAFVEKAQAALQNPTSADAQEISEEGQQLAGTAAGLTSEVISDPSLAQKITECSERLQNINQ